MFGLFSYGRGDKIQNLALLWFTDDGAQSDQTQAFEKLKSVRFNDKNKREDEPLFCFYGASVHNGFD